MDRTGKPLAITALFALGACVSPSGNGVLRSADALPRDARMVMAPPATTHSAVQATIDQATQSALTRLGYQFGSGSDFVVETAYSERPLEVSFETDGGMNSGVARLPNLAICTQRVQRLTLVITNQRSGRPVYQGQAEITQCADPSKENAVRLGDAAVAKLRTAVIAP